MDWKRVAIYGLFGFGSASAVSYGLGNKCLQSLSKPPPYRVEGGELVSVVIPTYNEEAYLPKALLSLGNQTYQNLEVIVADWNSEDATRTIAKQYGCTVVEVAEKGIAKARNLGSKQAKGEILFHTDSVPGYCPIMIKDQETQLIDIRPIEDLAVFFNNGHERVQVPGLEVRDRRRKWTQIKHVVRHPFRGYLRRIRTIGGLLDVTKNHSVYIHARLTNAEEVKVGSIMRMPQFPIEQKQMTGTKKKFYFGSKDWAWFEGFFVAEGSVCHRRGIPTDTKISNTNADLTIRAKKTLEDYFGSEMSYFEENQKGRQTLYTAELSNRRIADFFKRRYYTRRGEKKIPREILNAPKEVMYEFLKGFNQGDGTQRKSSSEEFQAFTTTSHTVGLGLIFLLRNLGFEYNIHDRVDKPKAITIQINKKLWKDNRGGKKMPMRLVRKIRDIFYDGYLYDIETQSHTFCGGGGDFLLHNSDVILAHNTIEKLVSDVHKEGVACAHGLNILYEGNPINRGIMMITSKVKPIWWTSGRSITVRKEDFWAIGGFNEELTIGEDVDFGRRLHKEGYRFIYDHSALVSTSDRRVRRYGWFLPTWEVQAVRDQIYK